MKDTRQEKWYSSSTVTGWHKTQKASTRHQLALRAHKRNYLSTARALQALANVTTDKQTKKLARTDALYFYDMHRKEKK